ncbi:MAG: GNAT family N-acetyltransferase [Candidatus Thiodiazotropha sp. (ex Codakia orbicularis)]|nr:GNAT family N-acetyltransferase [Candidatus Thiodiazotropha sp. (ex Codakia orbicularis)]
MEEIIGHNDHEFDKGPISNWSNPTSSSFLLVVVLDENNPIGLIYHGGPVDNHDVGWWIAKNFRRKGLGSLTMEVLASYLKGIGVTRIGNITIDTYDGKYNDASSKLVKKLKSHFT